MGFLDNKRLYPHTNIEKFIKEPTFKKEEHLSKEDILTEKIFLGFRSIVGVDEKILNANELKRAKILDEIVKKNNYNFRVKNKMPLNVHIENYKNGFYEGYDEFYNKMKIKTSKDLKGMWVMVNDYEIKDVNYAKI